jgi:hypothetical protein
MFIVPFAAAVAMLAPSYTLDYEVHKVGIAPDSEPQFARYTMRSESDSKLGARRLTMLTPESTMIFTEIGKKVTMESIAKDGTRRVIEMPASEKGTGMLLQFAKTAGTAVEAEKIESTGPEPVKEFRKIAGIECQKKVSRTTYDGITLLMETWEPVSPSLAMKLWALETYRFQLDGERRTLLMAETTIEIRWGKPPK